MYARMYVRVYVCRCFVSGFGGYPPRYSALHRGKLQKVERGVALLSSTFLPS